MATKTPFDWGSLVTNTVVPTATKILGDKLAPSPELMSAQTGAANSAANIEIARAKMANANMIRQGMMPGMFTNSGFSPAVGQAMANQYGANARLPQSPGNGGAAGGSAPGIGSTIGKTAGSVALGLAPKILGGLLHGGTAATAGTAGTTAGGAGLGSTIGALATNPITLIGAGALAAGLIWRKSQAHPEANTWTRGEQGPFDATWKALSDNPNISPEQKQATMQQNAQNYLQELANFGAQGGDKLQVARQAAATFRQNYGDPMKYGIQLPF